MLGGECEDIEHATSPSLEVNWEDVGGTIRVEATVSTKSRSLSALSASTAVVTEDGEACGGPGELVCPGEEESVPGEEGEATMYPEPEGPEEGESNALIQRFNLPFDSTTYSETLCTKGGPCGKYKGTVAAQYAERWALAGLSEEEIDEDANREYDYFGGNGGDCTNFVSQALHAGGLRFMRAHGRNGPNGGGLGQEEMDEETFLQGRGAWWSYYEIVPLEASESLGPSYEFTPAWVRAHDLYKHVLEYGLARIVGSHEVARPGDIVFYDLYNPSLAAENFDHVQMVVKSNLDRDVCGAAFTVLYSTAWVCDTSARTGSWSCE